MNEATVIKNVPVSFECMSPNKANLLTKIKELSAFSPEFISIPCHAPHTPLSLLKKIESIRAETPHPIMPHLIWKGFTTADLKKLLDGYQALNINKVLVLRGDCADEPGAPSDFGDSCAVVKSINDHASGYFEAWVAINPNQLLENKLVLTENLGAKITAGAFGAITQGFFYPEYYSKLRAITETFSSNFPVLPGIFSIRNNTFILRFCEQYGIQLPEDLVEILTLQKNDPERFETLSQNYINAFCKKLLSLGAPGLHFFSL